MVVAAQHVTNGVVAHMAHVQLARWVGEHRQAIVFGLVTVIAGFEYLTRFPILLGLLFDELWVVVWLHFASLNKAEAA